MGKKLTEAQIERYHRDGFVYPVDAFSGEQAWRYRQAMEQFEASQGRQLTKGHNFKPHLLWPILMVVVLVAVGLFVLSPWGGQDEEDTPALPTPPVAGTPNP